MRFIAALMVFCYHTSLGAPYLRLMGSNTAYGRWSQWAAPAGGLGVSFFFVLSGFVLTWSARDQDTPTAFWRRRFVKIYPNYVVTWFLAGAIFAWSSTPALDVFLNLGMLTVWIPHFTTGFTGDSPNWSLGVEALFYLSFPLLYKAARRIREQDLKYWIGGVAAAVILIPTVGYAAFSSGPPVPLGPFSEAQYYFSYVCPAPRLLEFALGILVARAVMAGRWLDVGLLPSFVLLAAAYVLSLHVPYLYGQLSTCVIPVAMVIAAGAVADIKGRFSPFRSATMVWLGNISFAFYLVHFITIRSMRTALGTKMYSTPQTVLIDACSLAITVLAAAILYYAVERPLVHRFSGPRRPVLTPSVATGG